MIHLKEFIVENIVHIFEGAIGINLMVSSNLEMFKKYMRYFFIENKTYIKCIDGDKGFDEFDIDLKPFCKTEQSNDDIVFYIKINSDKKPKVCLYEQTILSYDEEKLESLGIFKDENSFENYHLKLKTDEIDWVSPQIQSTGKKHGKASIKIWPKFKTFCNKWPILSSESTCLYDFGTKGAYYIPREDFESFGQQIADNISNSELENSSLIGELFSKKTIKEIQDFSKTNPIFKNSNLLSNIISEPLSILYVIYDEETIIKELLEENSVGKEISNIVIPLAQNNKISDFLIEINNSGILIPISVKSGNSGGNKSSILSLINSTIDPEYTEPKFSKTYAKSSLSFLKEFINAFSYNKKDGLLRLNKNLSFNTSIVELQNFALDTLEYANTKIDNKKQYNNRNDLIKSSYNKIIDTLLDTETADSSILKDNEIHNLKEIGKNGNLCEKFFSVLLNHKSKANERLARAVGIATNCFKITIHNNYSYSLIKQKNMAKEIDVFDTSRLNRYKVLNYSLDENGNLLTFEIKEYEEKPQGQALGYILH